MTKKTQGITVSKSTDFSEWYTQVINKAELVEYTGVAGCLVFRPASYELWERAKTFLNNRFKSFGVKNAYFPLLIPESLLTKESEHIEGFAPEVAWVTHAGNSELKERLAIRPTSETIMYDSYKKWIRSHRDLPLKINQWNNVVRWEFKHAIPFLRTREFLWQEGHTVFENKEDAIQEIHDILNVYKEAYEDLMAVPVIDGRKSDKEKFAGADITLSLETIFPNGKSIQGCTSHFLGQNFSKPFNISFIDKNEKKQYAYQNSWGFTTRSIGVMIAIHGDDKGIVLPPRIAPTQVVIIPILGKDDKINTKIKHGAHLIKNKLEKENVRVEIDDRDNVSPGWKYNEHELKGTPLRIELGNKELENEEVTIYSRDIHKKNSQHIKGLTKFVNQELTDMHERMYAKAEKFLQSHIKTVTDMTEFKSQVKTGFALVHWCGDKLCEESIKEKTGAKSLNTPFEQTIKMPETCFACKNKAAHMTYFGRSY